VENGDEELDGPAVSALRHAIAAVKQRWSVIGWVTSTHQPALSPRGGLYYFIQTYHSRFIPEGLAKASQILLRDTHILPKLLATKNTAGVTGGKPIAM
jgi:hypothetical protein